MSAFVVDTSVVLAWCFEDEATVWTEGLLERLRRGDSVIVPAHWPVEVSNGMLMALRRKRIQQGRPQLFWDELAELSITVEPPLSFRQAKVVGALCEQYGLTIYDGVYLELAKRKGLPLATLDKDLIRAAPLEGVMLVAQP
jgi:predicted nucleic acid-binding protein